MLAFADWAYADAGGPTLRIIFTSDTRGLLRRCGCSEGQMGGVSARATFVRENSIPGRTLVLDAGDTFFDEPVADRRKVEFYRLKMRALAGAMELAGVDASAVGEYDLALGLDEVESVASGAGFPFLSANIRRDTLACWDRVPFEGSTVLTVNGLKVGVVGVADSEFPYKSFPESMNDVEALDTVKAADYEVRRVRPRSDIVIVLAHLNFMTAQELAVLLDGGADIIIQGHSQEDLEEPIEQGGAIIVKGYDKAKHAGVLDIFADKENNIQRYEFGAHPLDESIPPDPDVESLIAGYRAELKDRAFDFSVPEPEGSPAYVGKDVCLACHEGAYAGWSGTRHAEAFETLALNGDEYDPECLGCHTTGYGFASGYKAGTASGTLSGVGCESCHGRGGAHAANRFGDASAADTMGRKVDEAVCRGCHDEANSPAFDYEEYLRRGGNHARPEAVEDDY